MAKRLINSIILKKFNAFPCFSCWTILYLLLETTRNQQVTKGNNMRIIETKVYTIEEHPNKEKCFNWIRDNWHDEGQFSVNEIVNSIKALSEQIGGTFDYSISQVPDRGEHITFKDYDKEALYRLSADDLPLTGVCWDYDLIIGLRNNDTRKVLDSLHKNTEYLYSNEGLLELCSANSYEFDEDGVFI